MKLIIDISEDTAKEIKDNAMFAESIASQIKWDVTSAIVNGIPLEEILVQIRAEIEELDRYYDNDYFSTNNCPMYKCNEVLQIIDNFKGERTEE